MEKDRKSQVIEIHFHYFSSGSAKPIFLDKIAIIEFCFEVPSSGLIIYF